MFQHSCIVVSITSLTLSTLLAVLQFANNKQTGLWVCGEIARTNITNSIYKANVTISILQSKCYNNKKKLQQTYHGG